MQVPPRPSSLRSGSLSVAPPVVPPPPPGFISGGSGVQPGSPGKSMPLRERTRPNSPPRFSSVPVETPPSKPTSSRSPILGRRNGAGGASGMSSNRSMTSLLAPLTSLGLFDGLSSLAGWFSYEPPARPSEKVERPKAPQVPSMSPLLRARATPYPPEARDDPVPPQKDFSPLQPPRPAGSANGLRQTSLTPPFQFRPDPMSPQRPQNASPGGLGGPRMSARSALQPQSMQQPQRLQSRVQSQGQNAQNLEHSQLPQHPQAFPQALHSHQPFDPRTIQHSQRLQHSMQQQMHPQTHSQSYYPVNYFASTDMQFIPSRPNAAEPPLSWQRQPPTPLSRYRVAEPKPTPMHPLHSNSRPSKLVQHVMEPPLYWQCSQAWQAPHVVRRTVGDSLLRESHGTLV